MSGFMGSETVVGSHKLFIGSRLNIKYVSEPSDMDSNLLIAKLSPNPNPNPTTVGGWVGFSSNSSSTRPAGRPTDRRAGRPPREVLLSHKSLSLLKEHLFLVL